MSLSFQRTRWLFAILGILLLTVATWLYPTASTTSWSNTQWTRSLIGTTWTFSRPDHTVISEDVQLSAFGRITGYSHPNEHRWNVKGKSLRFLNVDGQVTSTFPLDRGAPQAGLKLQSIDGMHHELDLHADRRGLLVALAGLTALLGLSVLATATFIQPTGPRSLSALVSRWVLGRTSPDASPSGRSQRRFINGKYCALGLLAIWFVLVVTMASMPGFVPDEAWFLYEGLRSAKAVQKDGAWVHELLFHANTFGYGGIWWSLYTAVALAWDSVSGLFTMPVTDAVLAVDPGVGKVKLLEYASAATLAPMVIMRILALSMLGYFGVIMVRAARSGASALLVALVLVTLPISWWSGKTGSPELFAAALFAIAVVRWFLSRGTLAALLTASFAVGIKLTIAPAYVVFVGFVCWNFWRQSEFTWPRLCRYALFCVLVVLACNSWLFYDAKTGIDHLVYLSHAYSPHPVRLTQSNLILFWKTEFWEGTNYGSLMYWSGGASLLVVALFAAWRSNRRLAWFLVISGLAQYGFMMTQPPHSWYWFPVILCMLIPYSMLGWRSAVCAGLVLFACLYPFSNTGNELAYKQLHLRELDQVRNQRQCVSEKLGQLQPDVVYDMASIGTFMSDAGQHKWRAMNFVDSYVALVMDPKPPTPGQKQLLLLGERSEHNIEPLRSRAASTGKTVAQCGTIKIVDVGG